MNKPLATIITVCRNSESTIARCVKSILPALGDDLQYLVMDGASTDSTLEQLRVRCDGNPNVEIHSGRDKGLYDAMNRGIARACGEYVWFINSDDALMPEHSSAVLDALKAAPEVDCLYGDCEVYETIPAGEERFVKIWKSDAPLEALKHGMIFSHQAVLCRRSLVQSLGGFNLKLRVAADWDLMLRLYNFGATFRYLPCTIARFSRGGVSCAKSHVWERHLVRKWNRCYDGCLDREWLDELKTICHDFLSQ